MSFNRAPKKSADIRRDAGDVAARVHEAFNKSRLNQIPGACHDNRNSASSVLGGDRHAGAADHDDIDFLLD